MDELDLGVKTLRDSLSHKNCREDLVYEALGFFYSDLKKHDLAIDAFDRAFTLNSRRKSLCQWGKANLFVEQDRYDEAIICYENSKTKDSDCASRALDGLAEVATIQDRYEEAFQFIQEGLELDPGPWVRSNLMRSLAEIHAETDQIEEALRDLDAADEACHDDLITKSIVVRRKAEILFEKGDLDSAMATLQTGLSLPIDTEDKVGLHFLHAKILLRRGSQKEAMALLDRSVLSGKSGLWKRKSHQIKYEIFIEEEKFAQAKSEIDKIEELSEDSDHQIDVIFKKINLARAQDKIDDALKLAEEGAAVCSSSPDRLSAMVRRHAGIYLDRGDLELASTTLMKTPLSEVSPNVRAKFHRLMGVIESRRGNSIEALGHLEKAVNSWGVPSHKASCLVLRSNIYRREGFFVKSRTALEDALKLSLLPAVRFDVLTEKSKLLRYMRNFDESVSTLEVALRELDDANAKFTCLFELGITYEEADDKPKAVENFKLAAGLPVAAEIRSMALMRAGLLNMDLDKFDDAVNLLTESLNLNPSGSSMNALNLAIAMDGAGRKDDDLKVFDRYIKIGEFEKKAGLIAKGWWYLNQREYGNAIKAFESAQIGEDHPLAGLTRFNLTRAYLKIGRNEDALRAAKQTEALFSSGASKRFFRPYQVHELLAAAHEKSDELLAAKDHLERAISSGSLKAIKIFSIDAQISKYLKKGRDKEKVFEEEMSSEDKKAK